MIKYDDGGLIMNRFTILASILLVFISFYTPIVLAEDTTSNDLVLSENGSGAQDTVETDVSLKDNWQITVAPYLWMLSLDGNVTVKNTKSPTSVSFGDVLDNLNFAFMGEVRVRKGRYGGYIDSIFGLLETDRETVQTSGGPARVKVEVDVVILEGGLFYRIFDSKLGEEGSGAKTNMKLDLIAGGRWTYLETKLDIKSSPNIEGDVNFFDPIVGFTSVFDYPHNFNLIAHGDLGGFSVGSEFTWQLWATLGYRFGLFGNNNANALVGYRALSQDYKEGSGENRFRWDVIIHGPIIGLAIDL
jgi:hypothetical protein